MTTIQTAPKPLPPASKGRSWWREFGRPPRIMGLDIARALAVLGMMAAHLLSTPELSLLHPSTWGALVHGRSSILFAVLAGISVSLMSGRLRIPDAEEVGAVRLRLVARGAVIFVIGLLLELLGTPIAVILTFYGALYVVAAAFVRWRPARLLIAAGVLALAGPPLMALVQAVTLQSEGPGLSLVLFGTYPLTVWLALMLAGMAIGRTRLDRTPDRLRLLVAGVLLAALGYGAGAIGLAAGMPTSSGTQIASTSQSAVVSASGSSEAEAGADTDADADADADGELLGVPSERIDFSGALCDDYGDGYISCYPAEDSEEPIEEQSAEGWSGYLAQVAEQDPWGSALSALVAVDPHSGGTAEVIGSGGFAVAVIAVCLLVSRPLRWPLLPFAALGSMPLTAYTAHVLSYALLAGPGGWLDSFDVWLVSAVVLLVASTVWSMLRGRGPLETLTARLSRAPRTSTPTPSGGRTLG